MSGQLCSKSCPLAKGEHLDDNIECLGKSRLTEALQKYFKFEAFRPGQLEALLPLVHGQDVFVRMATGAGKSLCMFLAPLALGDEALGVVISPLNALMEQQVKALTEVGVSAVHVGGSEIVCEENVAAGKFRFVFMAPETAVNLPWRNLFMKPGFIKRVSMMAVDEAHCIYEWGGDFRTCFKSIGGLRALCDAPLIALTATAPLDIKSCICNSLGLSKPAVIMHTLDRPNIYLSVCKSRGLPNDLGGLAALLKSTDPFSIPKTLIFCQTKDAVIKVYRLFLQYAPSKATVSVFHASLTPSTKSATVKIFQSFNSRLRILVATVAFGMGMDIPDIRMVVVYGAPDSLSQFYQLCGRAGRSGCQSRAHLFVTTKKLSDSVMQQYCASHNTENCLRNIMLKGLDCSSVVQGSNVCCSVCCSNMVPYPALDVLKPGAKPYRKRVIALREVTDSVKLQLEEELKTEREAILAEKPHLRSLGVQYVCSDAVIKQLCNIASSVTCVNDLRTVTLLRPELQSLFFNVIVKHISNAPPARKRRRQNV